MGGPLIAGTQCGLPRLTKTYRVQTMSMIFEHDPDAPRNPGDTTARPCAEGQAMEVAGLFRHPVCRLFRVTLRHEARRSCERRCDPLRRRGPGGAVTDAGDDSEGRYRPHRPVRDSETWILVVRRFVFVLRTALTNRITCDSFGAIRHYGGRNTGARTEIECFRGNLSAIKCNLQKEF